MKWRRITFAVAAVALTSLLAATALASAVVARPSLTVRVTGQGRVTSSPGGIHCPTKCHAGFRHGASVHLIAHPASGWQLAGWSGACKGAAACAVKLTASKAVRVTFTQVPVTPPGGGNNSPPPVPTAVPGHYNGTTGDNELFTFDIGSDGISLLNLQTGQINESCDPPGNLSGGNLSAAGPLPVGFDGNFSINATLNGSVDGNPSTDTITITGHVANGTASGTYREDTSFTDNGTAYSCTSGNQTWTASKA
jgi:hypothetical protein